MTNCDKVVVVRTQDLIFSKITMAALPSNDPKIVLKKLQ